mmetsp:Transcript_54411/g.99642  ORF Transcript_54411/g.99642 Transcript_54411/m.99642 type:complete len:1016 (+) Transcript_54411:77-3124(+)
MGLAVSTGTCGCIPTAPGEFEWPVHGLDDFPSSPPRTSASWKGHMAKSSSQAVQGTPEKDVLPQHRRHRSKGQATMQLLLSAFKSSRLFSLLDESKLWTLIDSLEYYAFDSGEYICREGEVGSHVFVSQTAGLEVVLCGGTVAELPRGRTFGELALFSNCPRSVSVAAGRDGAGVWGAAADTFRQVVQASLVWQVKDSRSFVDSLPLFEGLSMRQRDSVSDACTLVTLEDDERRVLGEGDARTIYFVKSGELRVIHEGEVDGTRQGSHRKGNAGSGTGSSAVNCGVSSVAPSSASSERSTERLPMLRPGDFVGQHALLYNAPFSMTVQATGRCELLGVSASLVRQILGTELNPIRLQRTFLLSSLKRHPIFASLSHNQVLVAVREMEFQDCPPCKRIPALPFFVVADGAVKLGTTDNAKVLHRGECYGTLPLVDTAKPEAGESPRDADPGVAHSVPAQPNAASSQSAVRAAGPDGCRLAVLPWRGVSLILEELGLDPSTVGWEDPDHLVERMALIVSKVCVFRHLPNHQIKLLVRGATRKTFSKGEKVIVAGERGSHFFIVVSGEVHAKVDDLVVRTMVKYAYFGERALLLDEPRAATIEVASPESEIWAIDKSTFKEVVKEKTPTAELLMHRMSLADHGIKMDDLKRLEIIGSGTSGVVQLVQHQKTGFKYALKRVEKVNGAALEVVKREIQVLAENDHPFIMHLVKTYETDKSFYMLTEYCAGGELHAAIRTIPTVLSRRQAMFYTGSLLLMLEALHDRNVVYRDLKPENIMLDQQGYLKLIDFGTAKKLDRSCPRTYTQVGTPHYMAPEVIRGKGYGIEVDVWALGVILYELMCGYLPFGDDIEPSNSFEVCKAVLDGDLKFPDVVDRSAKELIENLLVSRPASRLGCGVSGYQDIKSASFFGLDGMGVIPNGDTKGNDYYFALLISRELQAPIPPTIRPAEPSESNAGEFAQQTSGRSSMPSSRRSSRTKADMVRQCEAAAANASDPSAKQQQQQPPPVEPEAEGDPEGSG